MKTILALILIVTIAASTLHAQTVTITIPAGADGTTGDIPVLAGETLEVLAFLTNGTAAFQANGVTVSFVYGYPMPAFQNAVIAGPATVSAFTRANNQGLIFTYRKTVVVSVATQNIPSQTVAIPENTIAPADVILESSTDLNSWISALPGSFTPSALKRFFRLRLVLH